MKLQVKEIIKETEKAVSVLLKNTSPFKKVNYKAGQFITLNMIIDHQTHKRAYSFSSSPHCKEDIKITVKRVEKGLVSNYINDRLQVGDKIMIDPPSGSFYIDPKKNTANTYVLFAGGSGITPIFSIIKSVLAKEPNSKVVLIYANQDFESIIFRKELEALEEKHPQALNVEHVLSTNHTTLETYHTGLVNTGLVSKILEKHQLEPVDTNFSYMICGPLGYMETVKQILSEFQVPSAQIKVEVFNSPKVKVSGKDLIANVEIQYKGQTHELEVPGNQTILKAALSKNIVVPYACRAGMCVSCKADCISGEVKMTEGHFLEPEEVDLGKVLTCVSYPVSEHIVIKY